MNARGSTWNKWDLHVHTPDSLVNNYKSNGTDDIWESYIKDLESLPSEIKVLGINDYLFLDGYKKVLEYKNNGRLKNIDLLLPVLEFRLARFGGNELFKRINYHVIFSNEINPEIIQSQFLNALSASYKLSPEFDSLSWSGVISPESLIDLGNKIIASSPNTQSSNFQTPIIEGFNNINIEASQIENILQTSSYFKNKYLTAIGKTEWDRFQWNDNSIAEKKTIINKVNFIFTAAESVDNYNKGKQKLHNNGVNDHLLDCSDAHRNTFDKTDISNKNRLGDCNTWIKADTTFEGLKQILFEFDSRVRVQQLKPEEKPEYYVLDSIVFSDDKFCKQKIEFNQNLNTIIGGRATGKSTLLQIINAKVKNTTVEPYIDKHLKNVSIEWKGAENEDFHDIDYFGQGYMHDLADNKQELDKLVNNIIRNRDGGEDLLNFENSIKVFSVDLVSETTRLFSVMADLQNKIDEIKEKGNSESIKKELELLNSKLISTSSTSFTEDKLNAFEILCDTLVKKEQENKNAETYKTICQNCQINSLFSESIKYEMNKIFADPSNNELKKDYDHFILQTSQEWNNLMDKFIEKYTNQINENTKEIEDGKKLEIYKEGEQYKKNNKAFEEIKNRIELEKEKLNIIKNVEKEKKQLEEQINEIKNKLLDKHFSLIKNGKDLCKNLKINNRGLKISANMVLKTNELSDFISSRINKQSADGREYVQNFSNKYIKDFDQENKPFTNAFIDDLLKENIVIKGGNNYQNIASEFLSRCWYSITYTITYQNDKFDEMSPGKQAFVVLKLLLDFSKKKCPILIDQPEDSLDNRAIFNELVEYIRKTKIDRQIILVTHNANIVVGGDAEEVIVANQQGKNSPNLNSIKFQYLTGPLENTIIKHEDDCVLNSQGIREHVCEILEGGEDAFEIREKKYGFTK